MKKVDILKKLEEFSDSDDIGVFIPRDNVPCYNITRVQMHDIYIYNGFEFRLEKFKGEFLHLEE